MGYGTLLVAGTVKIRDNRGISNNAKSHFHGHARGAILTPRFHRIIQPNIIIIILNTYT